LPALSRLARLLHRRFRRDTGRSFVVLVAEGGRPPFTDDLPTQQIPVMRAAH
jgi:hypothetical protein